MKHGKDTKYLIMMLFLFIIGSLIITGCNWIENPRPCNALPPSNLNVTGGGLVTGGVQYSLVWDDNSNNEVGFRIERRLLPPPFTLPDPDVHHANFVLVTEVGHDVQFYTDVAPLTAKPEYRVAAICANGSLSDWSNIAAPTSPAPGSLVWSDDFENYPVGQFPSAFWTGSGNADAAGNFVDDSEAASGIQSLRLTGQYTGCWEALAHRPLAVSPPFTIEFKFFASGEGGGGCHPRFVAVNLTSEARWNSYGRAIVSFELDGKVRSWDTGNNPQPSYELGNYSLNVWHKVQIRYSQTMEGEIKVAYWLDDNFLGEIEIDVDMWYHTYVGKIPAGTVLSYLGLASGDSKVWFDDVKVWKE